MARFHLIASTCKCVVFQTPFRVEYSMQTVRCQISAYEQSVFLPAHLKGHEPTSVKQNLRRKLERHVVNTSDYMSRWATQSDAAKLGCGRALDPSNNQSLLMGLTYCIFAAGTSLKKSKWPKPTYPK